MSQLSNNTTALQALLEAVEALPEGGGTLKYAEGTLTYSYMTTKWGSSNYYLCTGVVTGLDFQPLAIIIGTNSTSKITPDGTLLMYPDGTHWWSHIDSAYVDNATYCAEYNAQNNPIECGFTIALGAATSTDSRTWTAYWRAIGI